MFVDVPQSGKDKGAAAPLISRYRYRRSRICARPPTAAPRRDVTDMIPCGALSRGRSFVNYFADRVIRCGENWERGDRWWSMGGKGRDTAWVCVWRRPCWRDTAGYPPRPQLGSAARRQELPLARPTFYTAQRRAAMHDARCTMHAMRHDAHTRSSPIYRRPQFLFDLHWQVGTEVLKKDSRPRLSDQNDLRRRSAIVVSLMFLCGRKIYIQFIYVFKMKRAMMSWWYIVWRNNCHVSFMILHGSKNNSKI